MRGICLNYRWLLGSYLLLRLGLYLLGVRFVSGYDWQHFHDVHLLKTRLLESLFYTHTFTPVINVLAGVTLKISEAYAPILQQLLFLASGCAFMSSLAYLLEGQGLKKPAAMGVSLLFSLTPGYVYFESLFHYEFLTAAMLTATCALFQRALDDSSSWRWFWTFLCGALLVYTRTTFHLVWLLCVIGFALLFRPNERRRILAAAGLPVFLAFALYAKNLLVFGFFGTTTFLPFNMAHATTQQLSERERVAWVQEHKLHPAAVVSIWAGPEAYDAWVNLTEKRGIPVLDELKRSTGPNYNHWAYLKVAKLRMAACMQYIAEHPGRYLQTVGKSLLRFFGPTSHWHPHDKDNGPHVQNRLAYGTWEEIYNTLMHGFPRPIGAYCLLLPLIAFTCRGALVNVVTQRERAGRWAQLALFMVFTCVWVTLLSCLVTTTELPRYRLVIEALLWVLCFGAGHLPSIVDQVEAGQEIELTRRDKPVAVVVSLRELERLRGERVPFGEAYRRFLKAHQLREVGTDEEIFASARDRKPGRKVSW